jgi:Rieske 2Fe-2S family protein
VKEPSVALTLPLNQDTGEFSVNGKHQGELEYLKVLIASRQPGRSLEQPFYTDPAIFERDLECIFHRCWLPVGFSSRIPRKGDYFVHTIGQDQIIIIRGADEQIHAHYNVCRHRGSRICIEPSGNRKKLVCPYHAWVYDCDGSFLAGRHLKEGTDKGELGLSSVHIRDLEGLIFICLAETAPDFEEIARDLGPYMKPHGLRDSKVCCHEQLQVKANWKVVAENQWECYHCAPAHPELAQVMTYVAAHDSKQKAQERGHMTGGVERDGMDEWYWVRRTPIRPGWSTQSADGKPLALLMGDFKQYDGAVTGLNFYPLSFAVLNNDYAVLLRFTPLSPLLTDVEFTWVVHKDAVEGVDFDPERVRWLWHATGIADATICENNQSGINSRHYRPGPHSKMEDRIEWLICWYLRRIAPDPSLVPMQRTRGDGKSSRQMHLLMLDSVNGAAPVERV